MNGVHLWNGIYESAKKVCHWRCTHLRQGRCLCTGRLVLDRGNDPGLGAADPTSLYLDVKDPLESLRPGHGYMTIGFEQVRFTLGLDTRAASLAMKSTGSNNTCVNAARSCRPDTAKSSYKELRGFPFK